MCAAAPPGLWAWAVAGARGMQHARALVVPLAWPRRAPLWAARSNGSQHCSGPPRLVPPTAVPAYRCAGPSAPHYTHTPFHVSPLAPFHYPVPPSHPCPRQRALPTLSSWSRTRWTTRSSWTPASCGAAQSRCGSGRGGAARVRARARARSGREVRAHVSGAARPAAPSKLPSLSPCPPVPQVLRKRTNQPGLKRGRGRGRGGRFAPRGGPYTPRGRGGFRGRGRGRGYSPY